MSTTNPTSDLTESEKERFILDIVHASSGEGVRDEELSKAFDALGEMHFGAVIFALWREGNLSMGWDADAQELTFTTRKEN